MFKCNLARVVAVLAGTVCTVSIATAAPIITISAGGSAGAQAAESAFLSSLTSGYHTETFEGYASGPAAQSISLATSVGTFTHDVAGYGGACDTGGFSCGAGVAVLDHSLTPFSGRQAAPAGGGNANWLDSMDAQVMTFMPLSGVNALGFYISDANDAGGRLSIGGIDFLLNDIFGSSLANGSLFYITLFDSLGLGPISLFSNNADDGYGLDSVTVAAVTVPEPSTIALLGLGLLGIFFSTRTRRSAKRR